MDPQGKHSYYEILNVSPHASREEIEKACVALWYKYQSMHDTPLWKSLYNEIERIHSTLVNPSTRIAYDKLLVATKFAIVSIPEHEAQRSGEDPSAATESLSQQKANSYLLQKPRLKFRNLLEIDALASALGFNQGVDWVNVEEWSDLVTIAWLALFFCLAGTFLVWSILHLLKIWGTRIAVE